MFDFALQQICKYTLQVALLGRVEGHIPWIPYFGGPVRVFNTFSAFEASV